MYYVLNHCTEMYTQYTLCVHSNPSFYHENIIIKKKQPSKHRLKRYIEQVQRIHP